MSFRSVQDSAVACFPDSTVLSFSASLLREQVSAQNSFRGYDLFLALLRAAQSERVSVGFYGGSPQAIEIIRERAGKHFPNLKVAFSYSPPFRPLDDSEVSETVDWINQSGVDLLFVGIGCPKQEIFMNHVTERLPRTTMIGVGAAFDFYAGIVKPSPRWVHKVGLEWLYRLFSEPKRLWRRYFEYNLKYIYYFLHQLLLGDLD